MKKRGLIFNTMAVAFLFGAALFFAMGGVSLATVEPVDETCEATVLLDSSPLPFDYNASVAYYNGYILYPGADLKIYAYDIKTGASTEVADVISLGMDFGGGTYYWTVGGLYVVGNYLYFHDNGTTSNVIYRLDLTAPWPTTWESLVTNASGFGIFAITRNPWTGAMWFCSGDLGGPNLYLYRITGDFSGASPVATIPQQHSGGNGPIIFRSETELLFGESSGDGYFHLINAETGTVIQYDYIQFSGGLSSAVYNYRQEIFVATGGGGEIYQVDGAIKMPFASADPGPWGLTFGGDCLYIADQVSYMDLNNPGRIAFNSVCCYDRPIPTLSQYGMAALLILLVGAALFTLRRKRQVG